MIWPFAPRSPPLVLFRTPWQRPDDGWSIAARRYARMMEMAAIDVRLSSWKPQPLTDTSVLSEIPRAAKFLPQRWDVILHSSALRDWEASEHVFEHVMTSDGAKAMHVVLERLRIDKDLAKALNKLDGVWAQCSANAEVLHAAGVKNVSLHLHPYFDDDPWLEVPPPKEHRSFLWIGRNEPRKAPDNLIRAFMRAFTPGEATLTLKVSQYTGAEVHTRATLQEIIEDQILMEECASGWSMPYWQKSIRIVDDVLSREEMVALVAEHDVYCSASRGEGLDLPAYQAKMAARTLCLTDSGGPRDFVGDHDELVPATGEMAASYEYFWGLGGAYADYRLDDFVAALQRVRAATPRGERLPGRFRAEKVAKRFGKWIRSLT